MIDFNDAEIQNGYELIPEGTIVRARISIKRDNGYLISTSNLNEGTKYLSCVFEIIEKPYIGRKFYSCVGIEGEDQFKRIGKARLRAILESAHGIKRGDESERAKQLRRIDSYGDLDGLVVQVKVKIKKDPNGHYKDKNDVEKIITPDCEEYVFVKNEVFDEFPNDDIPF